MEPLQEAIEKARKEREGRIGQTAAPGDPRAPEEQPVQPLVENSASAGASQAPESEPTLAADTTQATEPEALEPAGPNGRKLPTPSQVRYSSTRRVEPEERALSRNRVIAGDIHDPRVEAYRQLRSQVLASMKRHNWHTLAITSAHENAGKTLTAVNLAISISQEVSQTVMLVDLDLRKPNVHTTLDIDIDKGIVDHLMNSEPIENILLNPGYPRLVILPGMPQGRHSSEMLSSPEMKKFMEDITGRYPDRIIIFDLPPLLRNDDAMVFVPKADACLLVVEDGVTRPDDIERSLQLLKHSKLLGTILNKAR
jgi:protein-tyrosine kinase